MRFNRHVSEKKEKKKKRRRDTRSMKNDRPRDHYDGIDALLFIPCNFTSNSLLHFSLKGTFPLMNNLWFDETLGSTIFASSGKYPEESKRQYKMFYHIYIFIYIYIFLLGILCCSSSTTIEHEKTQRQKLCGRYF